MKCERIFPVLRRQCALTRHFIRHIFEAPCWPPFYLQNSFKSSWFRFSKMLEAFLRF